MRLTHKIKVAAVAGVASIAIAGAAFAYFTTTGAGTGDGDVGTSTALVLHGVVTDALYPGTDSEVTFTVDNSSTGHQILDTIHMASISTDAGHSACVMTAFTMSDVNSDQDFGTGDNQAVTATGTISMENTALNQDACKLAPLTLTLSSN